MLSSVTRAYIASEQFILDGLIKQAEAAVKTIYATWKRKRVIAPTLFTWPADTIQADNGELLEGICTLDLPEKEVDRAQAMKMMVERTKAYALLLIEQRKGEVRAVLESSHGARCWTIPLVQHGEVVVLGRAAVRDDEGHVGLLWSPTVG